MAVDEQVWEHIGKLWTAVDGKPIVRWGTVAQASPLTVNLDGSIDTAGNPVAAPAQSAISGLAVGDRVLCMEQHRRVIVTAAKRPTPFAMAAGQTTAGGWVTVTLPAARFTQPPILKIQIADGSAAAVGVSSMLNHNNRTTSSFQTRTSSGVAFGIDWTAVQMTPGSAAG